MIISSKRKRTLKIIFLLSAVWLAIVMPVPILWAYPSVQNSEEYKVYVMIAVLLSIPLAIRGIIWIMKPQFSLPV